MARAAEQGRDRRVGLAWLETLTAFGDAVSTAQALNAGRVALTAQAVLGEESGGDAVPLALFSPMRETAPPRFWPEVERILHRVPEERWGTADYPVIVASSNYGVGSILAYSRSRTKDLLPWSTPTRLLERLREAAGWGPEVTAVSHACVSAQLGLELAAIRIGEGAKRVLVFSFDGLSAFVTGGFHALKILNRHFPAPYAEREHGSIGLGDGIAAAVIEAPGRAEWELSGWGSFNEMHHMTANEPSGSGFAHMLGRTCGGLDGRRIWVRGHGTGTLEAGRLEAEAVSRALPEAPLVSWKGSLGHTLGSCALVELAVAVAAWDSGRIPGTPGCLPGDQLMVENVRREAFEAAAYDGALLLSNAFGGAHAGCLLSHA